MEFEQILSLHGIIIFSFVTLISTIFGVVYRSLKLRWPVKLNCWFCNCIAKVSRKNEQWWLCPTCNQYNGFSKSGDYNHEIPEQYESNLNHYATSHIREDKKNVDKLFKNGLCKECNKNENLKLIELTNFNATSERFYDKEQKPVQLLTKNHHKLEKMCRVILTILDSATLYNAGIWILPIGGLLFQLCACIASPRSRKGTDIIIASLWICVIILTPFKEMRLIKTNVKNSWFSMEYVTQHHLNVTFALIIGLMNIKPKLYEFQTKEKVFFKKLDSPKPIQSISNTSNKKTNDVEILKNIVNHNQHQILNRQSPINITNISMSCNTMETPLLIKQQNLENEPIPQQFKKSTNSFTGNTHNSSLFLNGNIMDDNYLNTSINSLSTLSISGSAHRLSEKVPRDFQRNVYNSANVELFRKANYSYSRSILAPPKLKSVTQTSWVAGGYWQEGMSAPTLSRSSSQSSGFDSIGSNFTPSREHSVSKCDFDQSSVTSHASQIYYPFRSDTPSYVTSYSQQILRPQNLQNQPSISSHSLLSPNFACKSNCSNHWIQTHKIRENDNIDFNKKPEQCKGGPILTTNSVWLPVLLCSSLVMNMIVLIMILLR
ncbi:uncharacterized protein [Prorops nasuta]|uniref:uncharacterized protein isoform X2 n=1 Tax=Prorops nasuta TaxID=863751 RepID=UPI0034CF8717